MTPTTTPDNPITSNSRELETPNDEYGWLIEIFEDDESWRNDDAKFYDPKVISAAVASYIQQNYTPNSEVERVKRELGQVRDLLKECIAPMDDDCSYDHHGYCQAHFLHDSPCPYSRAKEYLEQLSNKEAK